MSERALYRHRRRMSCYELAGEVRIQCATPLRDDETVQLYRDIKTGSYFARRYSEFHDGRFEPFTLPPGSDPSPCLDAKEMMRDVFSSWLKHRAAILRSPAELAAPATDAMERARELLPSILRYAENGDLDCPEMLTEIATTITDAVNDEMADLETAAIAMARAIHRYRSAEPPNTKGGE